MKDCISVALEMYVFNLNGNYIVQIIDYVPVTFKILFSIYTVLGNIWKGRSIAIFMYRYTLHYFNEKNYL